jgi:hypothetical protein
MRKQLYLVAFGALAISGVAPCLNAQRVGSGARSFSPAKTAASRASTPRSLISFRSSSGFHRLPRTFYPLGDLTNEFYPGDISLPSDSGEMQPVIGVPAPWAMGNTAEEAPRPPADPLIIELQGDRYVRVVENAQNGNTQTQSHLPLSTVEDVAPKINSGAPISSNLNRHTGKSSAPALRANTSGSEMAASTAQLTPAILMFRDGHSEEVRDYTIVDGMIYARGNLYIDGYWNKKIEVSALNVPQTVKSNEARGVTFLLPAAPNEVITRP